MMWRPNSLAEAIESGYDVSDWETRQRARLQYRCGCGLFAQPERIIDVRHLPIDEDWACDGCWTDWQRTGRAIDDGPNSPKDRREWRLRWVKALGAPVEVRDKVANAKPPDKYGKHRRV